MSTPLIDSRSEPGQGRVSGSGSLNDAFDLAARRRRHWRLNLWWSGALLLVWALVAFGVAFFARPLSIDFLGWPFSFWVAAQGALLVFGALVVIYAVVMKRLDATVADPTTDSDPSAPSFH
jgi:putative solute:sodium symporter small subunit